VRVSAETAAAAKTISATAHAVTPAAGSAGASDAAGTARLPATTGAEHCFVDT
jgi:hypothetical protein